ncbi:MULTISPECIES: multicopper oxidase domain-containing protein [unclassified Tolypothrix]|uniref:multicopper oxidase domain-containing protein n=1 Tax=unclassified Tolypothrix TaxID=2649714 RepID=UPI0005EAC196|nr:MULTISPECIES: multicopper oxidase domain-containing protein [unclassified Tolypothrix]EKE97045.1 Tat pathway signal sequence [Tolypothrix sp. PCC 7601]BAY94472.1 hypothetical protein NIES3275_65200 [Microchaete diplosiphon NIES-3275]
MKITRREAIKLSLAGGGVLLVRVIAQFRSRDNRDIKGKFMMHCHNLVHEDHAMMTQFEIGQGGLDPVKTAPALPISQITTL